MDERGSGVGVVLIAAGLVATLMALLTGVVVISRASEAQHAVQESALLAVDIAVGKAPGVPCDAARQLLAKAALTPESCAMAGYDARIEARVSWGMVSWIVHAHAGLASPNR